jgi:hypothetical protein
MRIWFDTEFIDDGKTIELLSIGMVREDGETYYAEAKEADRKKAGAWVRANVLPKLAGPVKPRATIAAEIRKLVGRNPEFWAYFASYDWVALSQLYGPMMKRPVRWPMNVMDVEQLRIHVGVSELPEQITPVHHALNDALWTREAWEYLSSLSIGRKVSVGARSARSR